MFVLAYQTIKSQKAIIFIISTCLYRMNEKVFNENDYSLHYLNIINFVNEHFSKHLRKQWLS
jgi:hypothetical protein